MTYTILRRVQGGAQRPHICETDKHLSFDNPKQAYEVSERANRTLKEKYGFLVADTIGVRDTKTGRFVA